MFRIYFHVIGAEVKGERMGGGCILLFTRRMFILAGETLPAS